MKLTDKEIQELADKLPEGWSIKDQKILSKVFAFSNFNEGMDFASQIAELADAANHHPDLLITYPSVTVELTTHDAGGITNKDVDLALQIEDAFTAVSGTE